MRLILSRKGFDSSAGGCPSPVFPDNTFYTLPIPDSASCIAYRDLAFNGINVGRLVSELTARKLRPQNRAHLDPDLSAEAYPRKPGWRPLLGQLGAAQGHLRNQSVRDGDLFLFFGLFREVEKFGRKWQFRRDSRPFHAIWGWLQIEQIVRIDDLEDGELDWARYHPHFQYSRDANNTLYLGTESLTLQGEESAITGAGIFPRMTSSQRLTAPDAARVSDWLLPAGFYPGNDKPPLSYHLNPERWRLEEEVCYLRGAARGQEFVLDLENYAEVADWFADLLHSEGEGSGQCEA